MDFPTLKGLTSSHDDPPRNEVDGSAQWQSALDGSGIGLPISRRDDVAGAPPPASTSSRQAALAMPAPTWPFAADRGQFGSVSRADLLSPLPDDAKLQHLSVFPDAPVSPHSQPDIFPSSQKSVPPLENSTLMSEAPMPGTQMSDAETSELDPVEAALRLRRYSPSTAASELHENLLKAFPESDLREQAAYLFIHDKTLAEVRTLVDLRTNLLETIEARIQRSLSQLKAATKLSENFRAANRDASGKQVADFLRSQGVANEHIKSIKTDIERSDIINEITAFLNTKPAASNEEVAYHLIYLGASNDQVHSATGIWPASLPLFTYTYGDRAGSSGEQ
jgi:hypothetical protein